MSRNIDEGKFTIEEVFNLTKQSDFSNRFDYAKRDRVRSIRIKKVHVYSEERPDRPSIKYIIQSRSTPQYKPYAPSRDDRGRYRKTQRSIHHHYDVTLVFGDEGMTLSTKKWKACVGSMRKVPDRVPESDIKTISNKTREKWKKKYSKEDYKKKVEKHRRKAKYVSKGDYIAQVLKINLDFIYRFAFVYWNNNHLYGRNYYGYVPPKAKYTNPKHIMAFPKHLISVIETLMKQGIITR